MKILKLLQTDITQYMAYKYFWLSILREAKTNWCSCEYYFCIIQKVSNLYNQAGDWIRPKKCYWKMGKSY